MNSIITIPRCYDSHAHFLATSVFAHSVDCRVIPWMIPNAWRERRGAIPIFGWGWKHLAQAIEQLAAHEQVQSGPWCLSRLDGHSLLLNSLAYESLESAWIHLERELSSAWLDQYRQTHTYQGKSYFVLKESLALWAWGRLLNVHQPQFKDFLLQSQERWLHAGFTHVRDMSGTLAQWLALHELAQQQQWQLYFVQNFEYFPFLPLESLLEDIAMARNYPHPRMRIGGVKLFLDGTIGFKTAAISCANSSQGRLLWETERLASTIQVIWHHQLPVCVHAIGDRAVSQALDVYEQLHDRGWDGELHIEHAELVRSSDLPRFHRKKIIVHLQPCHWTQDLKQLSQHRFWSHHAHELEFCPYRRWIQEKIPFFFGFDAPVYHPELGLNWSPILIHHLDYKPSELLEIFKNSHSYPDPDWGGECASLFDVNNAWRLVKIDRSQREC